MTKNNCNGFRSRTDIEKKKQGGWMEGKEHTHTQVGVEGGRRKINLVSI